MKTLSTAGFLLLVDLAHGDLFSPLIPSPTKNVLMNSLVEDADGTKVVDRNAFQESLQPSSNPCDSELFDFITEKLGEVPTEVLQEFFIDMDGLNLVYLYKLFVDQNDEDERFGISGEYTDLLLSFTEDVELFWQKNNPDLTYTSSGSGGVAVYGAHGRDIEDFDNRLKLCEVIYDESEDCTATATKWGEMIELLPDGYDNPLLTHTSMTYDPEIVQFIYGVEIRPTVIIGDGLLQFFEWSSVDPRLSLEFTFARDYGHVVQLDLDLSRSEFEPGEAQRIEVMADAMSAYYLTHSSGDGLAPENFRHISHHAATLGTEGFYGGPHGTPGQRECASIWGSLEARKDRDEIASAEAFVARFDELYARIFFGSAAVCPGISSTVACEPSTVSPTEAPSGASSSSSVLFMGGCLLLLSALIDFQLPL